MFKKLKKKLEEGEEGGIDRMAFSPRRLPGSAVRSIPAPSELAETTEGLTDDGEAENGSGDTGGPDYTELVDGENTGIPGDGRLDLIPTNVPNHLQSSLKPDTANTILLARISNLQQEQSQLTEQVRGLDRTHAEEKESWGQESARRVAEKDKQLESLKAKQEKLDGEAVELKLQVIELQLEKTGLEQELREEVGRLTREVEEGRREREEERGALEARVRALDEALEEKEGQLVESGDRVEELEGKVHNLESRLEAYRNSDENEVVRRLQHEVVELERRVQGRNIELELMETRLASELREKQEELQIGAERQETLSSSCKELTEKLSEKTSENRKMFRELEHQTLEVGKKEKEVTRLEAQVEKQAQTCQRLEQQLVDAKATDIDQLRQEMDGRIAELSNALDLARTELSRQQPPVEDGEGEEEEGGLVNGFEHEGSVEVSRHRRMGSGPAVLPVTEVQQRHSAVNNSLMGDGEAALMPDMNGEPATMQSHELGEELQLLREDQLRLQEEMSEKNKIIKVQQQKIIDIRKALNKELKAQNSVDGSGSRNLSRDPTPPPHLTRVAIASEVNFQYLKHVVIKFMCSREDEATQLIRAISTLLEFTPEEERHIHNYLEYKMSWFGSMPPPLYQSLPRTRRQSK